MRRQRFMRMWWWLGALALLVTHTAVWAAGTPAGTLIRNRAFANCKDANGNELPQIHSNEVTTTVAQVAAIDISPGTGAINVSAGKSSVFALNAANIGNGPDSLAFAVSGVPAGWDGVLYADLNGNGLLDGDEQNLANVVNGASLVADARAKLLLHVSVPADVADGADAPVTVTAISQFNTGVSDASTITFSVAGAVLKVTKSASPSDPKPGDVVTYTIRGANNGSATAYNVVISDPLPSGVTYVPGSLRLGEGADLTYDAANVMTDAADADPSDFGGTAANAVTVNWGNSPGGQKGAIFFRVRVNDGLEAGTRVTNVAYVDYESPEGVPQPTETTPSAPSELVVTGQGDPVLEVHPLARTGDPGDSLLYSVKVTNGGNGDDVLNISTSSTGGFPKQIWVDANGDGIPGNDGDYVLSDTNDDSDPDTGTLGPGETQNLILVVVPPPGTSDQSVDVTTIVATSSSTPAAETSAELTTTVRAPAIEITKSVAPAGSQPPGQALTYTIVVRNEGGGTATQVKVTDAIPDNTTYQTGSVTLNGSARTDAVDGDNAFVKNREVYVDIGSMGPGSSHTITFRVSID